MSASAGIGLVIAVKKRARTRKLWGSSLGILKKGFALGHFSNLPKFILDLSHPTVMSQINTNAWRIPHAGDTPSRYVNIITCISCIAKAIAQAQTNTYIFQKSNGQDTKGSRCGKGCLTVQKQGMQLSESFRPAQQQAVVQEQRCRARQKCLSSPPA